MQLRSILLVAFSCLPLLLFSQGEQIFFAGTAYNVYPETEKKRPALPSPYTTEEGEEWVVALTKDGQYAVMPVTLHDTSWWKQLVVDTLDFPALGRTGLHQPEELLQVQSITGRPLAEINRLARPGGLSEDGFLAADEDIISVLAGDDALVRKLGLTHPQLARPLFHILNMMAMDLNLNRWNMAKHEWEHIVALFYHGHKISLEAHDTKGGQLSPFDDGLDGGFWIRIERPLAPEEKAFLHKKYGHLSTTAREELERRLSTILTGELEPQYIMRYGFYEGHTGWRTDPVAISFIFGLKSLQEIERAFPGDLHGVLTRHFTAHP